jgi:hypothetical protein
MGRFSGGTRDRVRQSRHEMSTLCVIMSVMTGMQHRYGEGLEIYTVMPRTIGGECSRWRGCISSSACPFHSSLERVCSYDSGTRRARDEWWPAGESPDRHPRRCATLNHAVRQSGINSVAVARRTCIGSMSPAAETCGVWRRGRWLGLRKGQRL